MRTLGCKHKSFGSHARWIFICPVLLQSACLAPAPSDRPAREPESIATVHSALLTTPGFPIAELPMEVVSASSGQCMDVYGWWNGNGSPLTQYPCHGGQNQTFFFTAAGPDSYQIRVGHVAGKNLDIQGGSISNEAYIHIWDTVYDSQRWGLRAQDDGSYEIVSQTSNRCMSVANGSLANSANIWQFECFGAPEQRWYIRPRSVGLNLIAKHSSKCVDVNSASTSNDANVQQLRCAKETNQAWYLGTAVTEGAATYYPLVASHSGKCMEVAAGSSANGANVQQYDCNGGGNQLWRFDYGTDGYVSIVAKHSGKCVDVAGWLVTDNANIHQWACHGGDNQKFRWSAFDERHIHVVQVADSAGANRVVQSDSAIAQHVDRQRSVYGAHGLRLLYDPAADKSNVDSDALFHLGESGTSYTCPDGSTGEPAACATRYAFNWPQKLVIFTRPGGAFTSPMTNYIVTGQLGSASTPVCTDVPDTQVLAREFGHYLGLVDTFRPGDDRLSDTRPDPQAPVCLAPHAPTGTYNGATVDTNNVMSLYANDTVVITPMQASQARAGVQVPRDWRAPANLCGGLSNVACPPGQFCERAPGACTTPAQTGVCVPLAFNCPPDLIPVCGCDGGTYGNDCERQSVGVSLWSPGFCSVTGCPSTQPQTGTSCTLAAGTPCTYAITSGPNAGCARRFTCNNALWSAPVVACPQ